MARREIQTRAIRMEKPRCVVTCIRVWSSLSSSSSSDKWNQLPTVTSGRTEAMIFVVHSGGMRLFGPRRWSTTSHHQAWLGWIST